jgi:hypothetical protein
MATNTKAVGVAFSDPQLDGAIMGTATVLQVSSAPHL